MAIDSAMRYRLTILSIVLLTCCGTATAQPVVSGISKTASWPGDTIVLTGSGFNSNAAQNSVWFGSARGSVVSATAFSLQVTVPPQATYAPVEVVNNASKLSGKSYDRFMPVFSGRGFSAAAFPAAPLTNSANVGVFTSTVTLLNLCSCDFDGDGKPDVIATKSEVLSELVVLRNTSTIRSLSFASSVFPLSGYLADNVTCGDLNGDGKPDLLVSRASGNNFKNIITAYPNNSSAPGNIQFGAPVELAMSLTDDIGDVMVIRDLNADGKSEVIVTNLKRDKNLYVFENKSTGGVLSFNVSKISLPGATDFSTSGLEVEDFDGDGLPDIAAVQSLGDNIFIIRNKSKGALSFDTPATITLVGANLNMMVSLDSQADGKADLAITDYLLNRVVYLNNKTAAVGQIQFDNPVFVNTSQLPDGLDAGDINGDGLVDLAVTSRSETKVNILLGSGNPVAPFSKTDLTFSRRSRAVHLGDLDGDGKPDLSIISVKSTSELCSVDLLRNLSCYVPRFRNVPPLAICNGQTIRLSTTPGISVGYDWYKDNVLISSTLIPFFAATSAGVYTVTATGECAGAAATSDPFTLAQDTSVPPADPTIAGDLQVCSGGSIQLSTTLASGVTCKWSGPAGFTSTTASIQIAPATAANAGQYLLQLEKGVCKSSEASVIVSVVALSDFQIRSNSPANAGCIGGTVEMQVNNAPEFNYQWKLAGASIGAATSASYSTSVSGQFTAVVGYNGLAGCTTETAPVTITMLQPPVAAFSPPSAVCTVKDNVFTNTSTTDPAASALVSHAWTFAGGLPATSNVSNPDAVKYNAAQTSIATLTVSYSGVNGCSDTESKSFTVSATVVPTIEPAAPVVCPDSLVTLRAIGDFQSVVWGTGAGTPEAQVGAGAITVNTVDQNGCSSTAAVDVTLLERPILVVTANPTVIVTGQPSQLEVTGATTYLWDPDDGIVDPTSNTQTVIPSVSKWFPVTGIGANGCGSRDSVQVELSGDAKFPNVFSPNADGENDLWQIDGVSAYSACKLVIFDRNGNVVFRVTGYQNDWDGTWNGKPVPGGTYYFILECPDKPPITGNILIAR